ncbi:sugar phosphate isomerase/epimerase [Paracoccaceae bacterium]|nr:sugar phosphate isomerase/epimerase [Paracoccaceae bacterium]
MSYPANKPRYAARLNAFKPVAEGRGIAGMIATAARVEGMDAADLNYPDHFEGRPAREIGDMLRDNGLGLNGLAMRYYSDPAFAIGAFTNPDPATRRKAIDLTKQGLDALAEMGGGVMTLWMGQDGFDYALQADYARLWGDTLDALTEVSAHNRDLQIAIEYKPNEPRAFALMPDMATTLLAIRDVGAENLGVTVDFAHVLYANEMPAHVAYLAQRHAKILGVHLNDGYGKRDDGLMAGTVHPVATVELFVQLHRMGYDGVIYFDTFPDHSGLNPIEEGRTNILIIERLRAIAAELAESSELSDLLQKQNAALTQRLIAERLYGGVIPNGR